MITAAEISQTIIPHLTSLSEVRQLLDDAGRARDLQGDSSLLLPALDGLLGALEDIQLHAGTLQDARHRFILQYLGMEAEVLLELSLGRHMGSLASVGLWRDAAGVWQLDPAQAERLGPDALAELCTHFTRTHLSPFLRSWWTPVHAARLLAA